MKTYLISEQDRAALVAYLKKRPYEEVAGAIQAIINLKELSPKGQEVSKIAPDKDINNNDNKKQ